MGVLLLSKEEEVPNPGMTCAAGVNKLNPCVRWLPIILVFLL
jgi:hypothetical protein